MKSLLFAISVVPLLGPLSTSATVFPVGPYGFDSFAEFDNAFKRGAGSVQRDSGGFIYVRSGPFGSAVFDTSSAGGSGGGGGLTGSDANNDFSNFTISADITGSIDAGSTTGFYLRLDNNEANGYLAAVQFLSSTQIRFSLSEGASVSADGSTIFSQTFSGLTLTSNVFYAFKVSANGGQFDFDFSNGAATASFTDSTVSGTVGQVGFLLRNPQARLDNFAIVPEPHVACLTLLGAGLMLRGRRSKPHPLDQPVTSPQRDQNGTGRNPLPDELRPSS